MSGVVQRLIDRARRGLGLQLRSDLRWWERQVERHGPRAVLNTHHTDEEAPAVTEWQREILFPLFRAQLDGSERRVLDFGCGPGRFTASLAGLVGGTAVGVDPIAALLAMAPVHPSVEYRLLADGAIPLPDASVDVAWVCLVLMCIPDGRALRRSVAEIERVLRPGGVLFLVENTQERPDLRHLYYRRIEEYRAMFPSVRLAHLRDYEDLGERISVLAGRRAAGAANAG